MKIRIRSCVAFLMDCVTRGRDLKVLKAGAKDRVPFSM